MIRLTINVFDASIEVKMFAISLSSDIVMNWVRDGYGKKGWMSRHL